ncbi:DUF4123 domain-containing protein [Xanthomonas cerealis]|uniref:DUF4123 domain-containing protein n=1 Tax=Xanthomonas cerealis TaxID=3390025 RepID=UPI000AA470F0|nr:DUF4123 domain-containing protein [Xanthomonas translucens]UKE45834.1 hypothetical protein KHA79_11650 [Xanthomonas translucens pv. cerealis]
MLSERDKQVEALSEKLHCIARSAGVSRCCVLMQSSAQISEGAAKLQQALDNSRNEVVPVNLAPMPKSDWPYLVVLDIAKGHDAWISALAMEAAQREVQWESLQSGRPNQVCAWILGERDPRELSRRIAKNAIQRNPQRKRRWLRFYDPCVIDLYWDLLTPTQRLLSDQEMGSWLYVDRYVELRALSAPEASGQMTGATLSNEQWDGLEYVGSINQSWIRLGKEGVIPEFAQLTSARRTMVATVPALGIDDSIDLDLFAYHAIKYGPGFHADTSVQQVLRRLSAEEGYAYLMQGFSEEHWAYIRDRRSISLITVNKNGR